MGLGAAGCGYEYRNTNGLCGHLDKDVEGNFLCLKYLSILSCKKICEIVGSKKTITLLNGYGSTPIESEEYVYHPIRCKECKK